MRAHKTALSSHGKISVGEDGIGVISPEMVEERASGLAKADGRAEVNERDRASAREELLGVVDRTLAPELDDPEEEGVTEWDDAPSSHGQQAPRLAPEDEAEVPEELVEEGLDEADHDQRVSASEETDEERE